MYCPPSIARFGCKGLVMKKWFALALFIGAVAYTAYGLSSLSLYTFSGRPAAGFFPLIVGVLLVTASAINGYLDLREWLAERRTGLRHPHQPEPAAEATAEAMGVGTGAIDGGPTFGRDVLIVLGLIALFVVGLKLVGALTAMLMFMLAYLFIFNRHRPLQNIVYSLALPGFLYGLFKVLLNASLPLGPLGF